MEWAHNMGLVLGVTVTNALIYYFTRDANWLSSIGFGSLAGAVCAVLLVLVHWIRS